MCIIKGLSSIMTPYAHRIFLSPQRRTCSVDGLGEGDISGLSWALGGMLTSWRASVGQEPMHDKHPTHCSSTTTTGRFLCFLPSGLTAKGSSASKGQCVMQRSHPVQSACTMATID